MSNTSRRRGGRLLVGDEVAHGASQEIQLGRPQNIALAEVIDGGLELVAFGDIVDQVKQRKAHLRILGMSLDTETATGGMMLPQVLGAVAEHERAAMLARQREGIAKAKADGKYKGRARTAMAKAGAVERLLAAGVNPTTEVARTLGIGRSSAYRTRTERRIRRVAGVARIVSPGATQCFWRSGRGTQGR